MDSHENTVSELDDLELPAAKKICLDNNDVSNSFRNNSSLSDSTLHLENLFSPRQSLSSCSINDGVDNSTFSTPIQRNQSSDENKSIDEDENKVFTFTASETDDKADVCTVMSNLNKESECVKIVENDKNNCSSLSKFNSSNLSIKAFKTDESLDFMDETCYECHSDDDGKEHLVSIDVKSVTNLAERNGKNDVTTCIHEVEDCVNEDCINLSKKSDNNCSNKLEVTLDYTCKPDAMGEETLVLCHSIIKKDAMSPSCKLFLEPSLISMSIDDSLVSGLNNISSQPTQEAVSDLESKRPLMGEINYEDSDCEKICDDFNSTNLYNEVSGCVLDYTCSKSVGLDVNESFTETSLPNKVSETSINVILECSNAEQQGINKSNLVIGSDDMPTEDNTNMNHENCLNLKENCVPSPENPVNDLYDLSDLKNSFISNKTFSAEEVNFLKENLLKVMELLKNDNNSFESYKLASENEKRELFEKIQYLESNSIRNHEFCADILTSQQTGVEGKIDQSGNYNIILEELSNTKRQYNNLLQLVLVTVSNWTENKLFVNFLSDLNIAHDELFIPIKEGGNEYVINHNKIYDLMLSLSKKISESNSFKEECFNILRNYEMSDTLKNRLHIIGKECEDDLFGNLKVTFEEILNSKNYLEKENAELKKEACNKSDEIKMLSSTIEKLNQQLNILKETALISTNSVDKFNNVSETNHNLSREVTEKIIINDSLDESNVNIPDLKESLASLKNALSLSEENYNNLYSKCEKYEVELQKMRDVEQVYQELLVHHNVLKTEVDSKCCKIEKLNAENQNLIDQIDELKLKYEIKGTDDKSDPKIRFETAQKSLVELGDNHNEILASYDQTSKNLSSKNIEIALLHNGEENLKKEFEMSQNNLSVKENFVELQENCDCSELQFLSTKDEVSKLQLDLNCLNERYSEMVSDFDKYKEAYTHTEHESILWKEEKQSLECELDSLKLKLESALEESSKLNSDKEEINNNLKNIEHQLCEAKQNSKDIQNSYENLKMKYEESVVEINDRTLELQNLLAQLSELETTNADLKIQLSGIHSHSDHNNDLLRNEVSELKIKCDTSENLLIDLKEKHNEIKLDLESKNANLLLLTNSKEQMEKELELFNQNETLLKQKIVDLQEDRNGLEVQFLSSRDEVSKLRLDLNCLNEKYSEVLSNFDLHKQTYSRSEDEFILWKEEKPTLECELDSFKSQLESALEESSKLKSDKEEINNKLEKLLAQLSDLETTNANLKTQLSGARSDLEYNEDSRNNEISELKRKCETSEKLLINHENKNSELKVSYDKICEDLESKNAELSLLTNSKEKLEKELEIFNQNETLLKQKIIELQEDRNGLEIQFLSSKEEVSKFQLDFDCLKEKYSEMVTDFGKYKETYTCTEEECISLQEEKQSLKCELDSLKSQLESALEESSKLKSDKEEINNLKNIEDQLCEAKQSSKDIQNSYENLKTKYEESVVEINNRTLELKNLLAQLSDLETTNANLKIQLSGIHSDSDHNIHLLQNEISELKIKLDTTQELSIDHIKEQGELKISYDKVCEDLKSKDSDLSVLTGIKEQLEKELEAMSKNDTSLKQKIIELQENRDDLEVQYLSSKNELSKLQLDLNCLNEKYSEILSDFDLYKQTFTCTEDESSLWKKEKQSFECELDSLKSKLESALEESSKLKSDKEEINNNLKNIENQLCEEKQSSRCFQDSYENLKTKYEESIVDINNKTIELQNLTAQLTDLETTNGNLKNELCSLRRDSENNTDLMNQEVLELKRKCETSEKLLIDHENKNSELKVSYDRICEDLESKNAELSLLTNSKEKLEKELEIFNQNETLLKQKIIELQEDRNGLEIQFLSSKEEVSKFQLDFDCLKEKYSEIVTDFGKYKETYTCTEEECISLQEEKQSLKCELDSLKSELESVHEELHKLKSDYEENNKNMKNVENQLCDERMSCRNIQSSFENLKTKYEESVAVVDNKTVEIQNLLGQLSDLEASNVNLKSELNVVRSNSEHNLDLLNKEILELKEKYETSEKLLVDLEEKHNELKVSYNQICEDLKSKQTEFSLLTNCKEQLEKEIDTLTQNNFSLNQKLTDLEINVECHKKAMLDLNIQLDSANAKIDRMKSIEMQISVLKGEYDILPLYCTRDLEISGEQPFCLFSDFVYAAEAIIKDLIIFKAKSSEEVMKLSSSQEEVSRLNILLDSLKEEIKLSAEESGKLNENYSSLSKQYNSLLDASKDSNIRCNSLLEKLKELESHNSLCKSAIQDLKSEVTAKESIIVSLSNTKELYESVVKENETLSSQLMEKIEEYETALGKLKNTEENYLSLKLEYNTLTNEITDLRNKNETLKMKCNENYALYVSGKGNIEILQKEKEEIRKNFIKCEKDYQNSLDLVQKCQENMGNLDKQYNLTIAKLNVILKEKESYESQNLSLQKINDELVNRIKELNSKCQENQNMLMKFRELEKSYEEVSIKHQCLERQLVDYGNLKRENEVFKTQINEKDSFNNNLSINYNALKEKCNALADELKSLSTAVLALLPGENSLMEIIKLVGEKLQDLKKIENDLEEQKMKCQNLDEECNLLNEDLNYKDVVIGDMYKDHSSQMNELKELLKKEENLRQEVLLENSTLKDKIKCLDSEIVKLKTTEQSVCSSCVELKSVLQKLKMDLVDNSSKVTTLQLQIEENEITNKKKIHDYRKKISSLQEELGAALNKLEDNRMKNEIACLDAFSQTESLPVQISGQSGIVQSFKIKEQEERIQKFEKENLVLKRMCQSRLQTIQELKTKLENVSKPQKTQRNVLEEVQNHQSS